MAKKISVTSLAPVLQKSETKSETNQKSWALLIYMAADNNLSEECVFALTEIQKSITNDQVVCIAQLDPKAQGVGIKRYVMRKFEEPESAAGFPVEPMLESTEVPISDDLVLDETALALATGVDFKALPRLENSADRRILENFLTYGLNHADLIDRRNLVVLSGHGNGAVGDFLMDENPPSALGIIDISKAFYQVSRNGAIDILGMDSCLMSMVEVCVELSGSVGILIGSEGFMLNAGWPYHRIIAILSKDKDSDISPADLAKAIVGTHVNYYSNFLTAGVSVDLAACDLHPDKIKKLNEKVRDLVNNLLIADEKYQTRRLKERLIGAIILAHWKAQSYKFEQYTDLYDFCGELFKALGDLHKTDEVTNAQNACQAVLEAIREVVLKAGYCGSEFQYSHGLSVYFPWAKSDTKTIIQYQKLAFSVATKWGEFLYAYVRDTQRPIRDFEANVPLWPPIPVGSAAHVISGGTVRTNPELENSKTNPELQNPRTNPELENPRGKMLLISKAKNPPTQVRKGPQDGTPKAQGRE
jgi:Clostripain family